MKTTANPHPALARERKRSDAYRRASPLAWWGTLLAPIVLTLVLTVLVWLLRGWEVVVATLGTAAASLFFGKFIILGGTNGSEILLSTTELVALVIYMDVMVGCWFVFHLGVMLRLPTIGPRFALLIQDGEYVIANYPWVRRAAFIGLVLFMMVPFAMTGSVGGSILARLLGLSRRATFTGICVGSAMGAGLMYLGSQFVGSFFNKDNPLWAAGGVVVLIALILLINHRYAQAKSRAGITTGSQA